MRKGGTYKDERTELADLYLEGRKSAFAESCEKLAAFIIAIGYSTGHGDTMDDLFKELGEQIGREEIYQERIRIAVTKLHCLKDVRYKNDGIDKVIATLEGRKP